MPPFQRHVFVCVHERHPGDPRGCCRARYAEEVRDVLRSELNKRNLGAAVRANNAGCLDACDFGVAMVIYPEGIWYAGVTPEDVPEIVEQTVVGGRVIERLLAPAARFRPSAMEFGALGGLPGTECP